MPLDVGRLRDSDLAALATGDEFKAAVLLWCASWHQTPAGSLPTEDRVLARLSGLDAKTWARARAMALRGWIECSDGRLYHPVVAEKAIEAWHERLRYRQRRENDRDRLRDWRDRKQVKTEGRNASHAADGNADETRFEARFETSKTGTGTGTGTGTEENAASDEASSGSPMLRPVEVPAAPSPRPANEIEKAFALWNELARRLSLPVAKDLTPGRRTALKARLSEHGPEGWRDALAGVEASRFCRGMGDKPFKADLDFICQPKSFQRLRERFYGEDAAPAAPSVDVAGWGDAQWARAMQLWRSERAWSPDMGPSPGQPGCRVPASILAQHGHVEGVTPLRVANERPVW
ncbi:MAG TPA: DUF1376 domain-containing protein [Caulobacteraceae bacterium]|nr:DUF1376 domain-containing protein [Caulobacteraceae bacterium]